MTAHLRRAVLPRRVGLTAIGSAQPRERAAESAGLPSYLASWGMKSPMAFSSRAGPDDDTTK
jgi:hypothetical protein